MQDSIRTENLTRTFRGKKKTKKNPEGGKDFIAVNNVSLSIREGELFGLLGPNGAGKTTLIKILTTLLAPTSGRAWIDGHDVVTEPQAIRPKINLVSGGESCGYGVLNVRENLWLFSQIYGVSNSDAKERIDRILEVVGLADKASTRISHLSTGQRQKMNFCRGFITDPKILFLDEPTLGLDVNAARSIRSFVKEWLREKPDRTMLLTTHYMSEADELCDRLAIIERGQVLACDTPAALKKKVQEYTQFSLTVSSAVDLSKVPGVHKATTISKEELTEIKVSLLDESAIGNVVKYLVETGGKIVSLKKDEPTLEDAFIELVGHGLDDKEASL
ncbi:ABC transporter ATP-binding protein [Telmatocola sphagniphila]|uniref:ABC transporter ATP-binding protein n=1 Tax=Telmatocola sphagniphila TaxID=1123043 RepID=A0A8E6B4U0_9BACT|nr:ABC transporter ATP-binding protein [Telmatocola sphagniphila]QVL31963.1 ABC transporter ATP-binding protein [Telmatocola sphagniphila]